MFDVGWSEILVVAIVAIVVVGPKDLPKFLRAAGRVVRQVRQMAREFQGGIEEFIREAELDDVKNSIHHVSNYDPEARGDTVIDPTGGAEALPNAMSPDISEDASEDAPGNTDTAAGESEDESPDTAGETPDAAPRKGALDDGKGDGG